MSTADHSQPTKERIHFVTGRLAERALRAQLAELAPQARFDYSVEVLPITVAALMTTAWVADRMHVPPDVQRLVLPGYCHGDLEVVSRRAAGARVERGPRDLRELPDYFGQPPRIDYGAWDIEILAEINHAPRLSRSEMLAAARAYRAAGADIIDVGCEPHSRWTGVADCVRALRDEGYRVSIDSLQPAEIADAVRGGAELVLSVHGGNRAYAPDWPCSVVAIPDDPATLAGLDETIEFLTRQGVSFRVDPILEPIGCGFAASLGRYLEVRRRYPQSELLMGIGNLTELTDCDSAAVNVLLLGFCQEVGIRSVLTTQVIPWAQTSVRECALARRLVYYAVRHRLPPKHMEPNLVVLRDPRLLAQGAENLDHLATLIRDHNYRLFAEGGTLHLVSAQLHLEHADPFELFQQLLASLSGESPRRQLTLSHAFYLGYEAAKAVTALTLGKQYRQDEALDWGFLTRPEPSHRQQRYAED